LLVGTGEVGSCCVLFLCESYTFLNPLGTFVPPCCVSATALCADKVRAFAFFCFVLFNSLMGCTAPLGVSMSSTANTAGPTDPRAVYGKTPQEILAKHVSWLTESFVIEVISRKLEVKDLIKLLPEEERPKGRTVPHGAGVFFDIASKTTTITEGGATAYDKDIPDLSTLMSILSIYGLLRTIFDQDNTGIGAAIFVYQKTLYKWYKHDCYTFSSVRAYFIAHFRQYQTSDNPDAWMRVDSQLFLVNLVRATPSNETTQSTNKRFNFHGQQGGPPRESPARTVCMNYNTPLKNCSWSGCQRQHICDTCGGPHPAFRCKKGQTNFDGRVEQP
jgi:hypothetical protein